MVKNKEVILFALLVGNNFALLSRPYYYQRHTKQAQILSENAQKAIAAGIVVGGVLWWQKSTILHGARYVRYGFSQSDSVFCYHCQKDVLSVTGDCGYGLCRDCFAGLCRLPYCSSGECGDGYCRMCLEAYQQSWFPSYFEWKRSHCPTCYGSLTQIEEK